MPILSTSHIPHSVYMISYMYWFNIPSVSVTVTVCFTLNSCFPGIDINTQHDFKSTLILTNIPLKTLLDVCLVMNMKIQTQKTFSEIIFPQFVLVLTLFAYYPCFLSFLCVHMLHLSLQPKTIIRGAKLMDISSWKSSLQAYGIRIWEIWKEIWTLCLLTVQRRVWGS